MPTATDILTDPVRIVSMAIWLPFLWRPLTARIRSYRGRRLLSQRIREQRS